MEYINREIEERILEEYNDFQVIAITGPRQTGKTTLSKHLFPDYAYYNLEDGVIREAINANPRGFILDSERNMIIDEIQLLPELFSYIQVCVDENPERRFVITGSSDFSLMEKISQSLAGRVGLYTLLPFSFREVKSYVEGQKTDPLMINGFYPGTLVKHIPPYRFYSNYISTYVEKDVRQIKSIENLDIFRSFLRLLAGRASTEFNASSLSMELGVTSPTIKSWLGILKTSYIVFTLMPFYSNINKRLTKTPKIYFYDTGILCNLLGIKTPEQLAVHPLRGAIFENLAVTELLKEKCNKGENYELCFYRENSGREVDVMKVDFLYIYLYEIKSSANFNKSFIKNLAYLKTLLGDKVKGEKLVYEGPSVPPSVINIRQL